MHVFSIALCDYSESLILSELNASCSNVSERQVLL